MPPKKAAATGAIGEPKKSTRPSRAVTAPKAEAAPAPAPKKATPKKAAAGATKKAPAATTKKTIAPKRDTTKKTAAPAAESDKENQGVSKRATASKRKRDEEEDEAAAPASSSEEESEQPTKDADGDIVMTDEPKATKRRRVEEAQAMPRHAKRIARPLAVINEVPTQVLDVFVFGEGTAGELGLGSVRVDGKKPIDVKRPRLNHNLKGVVQVACGGMHLAVLTSENKILTWGVNDQGALGRDTTWDGGLRDVDAEEDSDDEDDTGMNPKESTPAEIDTSELPEDIKWVQVVASDSATFALTTTGQVYGWGTFRSNEGVLGFSRTVSVQKTPALVPEISKITQLAAGLNHILALDNKNKIFAWGAGQQAQLARRLLERDDLAALYPTGIGALPGRARAVKLACGSYHSFVIDSKGRVISWGLNNYAECGHDDEVGVDGGYVMRPRVVESLKDHVVTDIAGGEHHSLACTSDGKLLTWGRIDGNQVGQPAGSFSEDNTVYDDRHLPRILVVPTEIASVKDVVQVAAGTDHSFAVTKEGKVYSWGFSANYQTGQGTTDDIKEPEVIDNTAIRNRKIVYAGGGGQYGIVAAVHEED